MNGNMKKHLRAIQTLFPFLQDARFNVTSYLIKMTGNPHEEDFFALEKFKPDPEQVLIDVGADRGLTIISMLIFPHMQNKIIAFEPNSLVFNKLKNNFLIKKTNRVDLRLCGLSDRNDQLSLYIPFYRKWMFDGLASLNYESAKNWLTHRLWMFDQQKLNVKRINCEVRKLDDFNFNPYFIKIDVQGHELQVLMGSENTIRKHQPIFLIECVNEQIIQFLKKFNYLFYRYSRGEFSEGLGELNTFCMTEKKFYELTSATKLQRNVVETINKKKATIKEYELENA